MAKSEGTLRNMRLVHRSGQLRLVRLVRLDPPPVVPRCSHPPRNDTQ